MGNDCTKILKSNIPPEERPAPPKPSPRRIDSCVKMPVSYEDASLIMSVQVFKGFSFIMDRRYER